MRCQAILVLMVAATLLVPRASVRAESADPEKGRQLFVANCAQCHGESGHGDGPRAGSLKTPPANLTQLSARNNGAFPSAKIVDVIRTGSAPLGHSAEMPSWSKVFGFKGKPAVARGRVDNLVHYIESLQGR